MKRTALAAAVAFFGPMLVGAQEFEVASVKPSDPGRPGILMRGGPGQTNFTGVTLRLLIQQAYGVKDSQILGGPGWIGSDRYDVIAKAPDNPDPTIPSDPSKLTDEQRQAITKRRQAMMQALLADRFQLKVHRETREMPVYVLTVAKGGPKLKDNEGKVSDPNMRPGMMRFGPGNLMGSQATIAGILQPLSQMLGRIVIDQTGLTGKYDFELKWTPDQSTGRGPLGEALPPPGAGSIGEPRPGAPPPLPPPDPNGPNVFTALQEQLGLKLESSKGPVEVVVIDRAEKPTEN